VKTVRLLLDAKGRDAYSIQPDRTVFEALQILSEKDIGALLVMEGINLLGIISERDYARKVFLLGKTSMETLVHEIMTVQPVCVRPDQSVGECMALMTERRVRHRARVRRPVAWSAWSRLAMWSSALSRSRSS